MILCMIYEYGNVLKTKYYSYKFGIILKDKVKKNQTNHINCLDK